MQYTAFKNMHTRSTLLSLSLLLAFVLIATKIHASQATETTAETSTKQTRQKTTFKPLQVYQAEYKLKSDRYNISATAKRNFSIDKNKVATIEQSASIFVASIEQSSDFKMQAGSCEIQSLRYTYKRSVFGKKKTYRIEFDHNKNQFMENKDGDKKNHPIENDLYDELSYQEALRCQLKNAHDLTIGKQFSYLVRTKGRNKDYTFEVAGEEVIDTALGKLNTLKLTRIRSSESEDEQNYIWFSKEHDYMLVKLKQEDEDDKLSLDINKLKQ